MRFSKYLVASFLLAVTVQACGMHRPDRRDQRPASTEDREERKEAIIERLIPENGLSTSRRTRLIDATIAVLGRGEREELANIYQLRLTLRDVSLRDLEKIEADYRQRISDAN